MARRMSSVAVSEMSSETGSVESLALVVAAVQHEAAPGFHRPAIEDRQSPAAGLVSIWSCFISSAKESPGIGLLITIPMAPLAECAHI